MDQEPSFEDLDVSMTQDPLVLFIPYGLAVTLGTGMFAVGNFLHTWKTVFIAPPLWVLAAVIIRRDRNAIKVLHVKLRHIGVWLLAYRHGGWTLDPPKPDPTDAVR